MSMKHISVVIVTRNSEKFIVECLSSMRRQTACVDRIIVMDNGSSDATVECVRDRFPDVHIVELGENTGFCRANNAGYRQTTSEFVLFANPDTVIEPDYIEKALAAFDEDARIGMVSGKLLRFDRRTIDSAGQVLTRGRKIQDRGYGRPDDGSYGIPTDVDSVCGAMMMCRRKMMDDIASGGEFFDEDFFAFGEDMDVGWRARRFGWRVHYVPAAVGLHFRGSTQEKHTGWTDRVRMAARPPELKYHIVKNRWLMMIKNETLGGYLRNLPWIWTRDMALLAYLLFSSPSAIWRLVSRPAVFVRARQKCRDLRERLVSRRVG